MVDTACIFAFITKHTGIIFHRAKHHFRVFHKVGIDSNSILRFAKMYPVRFCYDFILTLLQKNNVTRHICPCAVTKCCIRKSYRPNKLRPLRQIFTDCRIGFIQRTLACDKSYNTSRSDLIQCFCKEIIMNAEVMLCILLIIELKISKRDISYCNIKKVIRENSILKSAYLDFSLWIEQLCNPAGNTIFFHAIQPAFTYGIRHCPEKMTDSHRRL